MVKSGSVLSDKNSMNTLTTSIQYSTENPSQSNCAKKEVEGIPFTQRKK
jgi:hypothetical protein